MSADQEVARPLRLAVTGPEGFLAWHVRCAWRAQGHPDVIGVSRTQFNDPEAMDAALINADAVIHLAGVNRAPDPRQITDVNPWLASQIVASLQRLDSQIPVVFGNSMQSLEDSIFGAAKRRAAEILKDWGNRAGAPVADVLLPNIFGEHGRPFYNSVVATFCDQLARGEVPRIEVDRTLPLLHAQRAAHVLLAAVTAEATVTTSPPGRLTSVSQLLAALTDIHDRYATADLPDLSDSFARDLFNTYRSYTFPQSWPVYPPARVDDRGELTEVVKAAGGQSQVFFSTTRPGVTRGQHFHLRKVERFVVVRGEAVIRLRRLFSDQLVEFDVRGDRPAIIDMPTMWVHSITNVGTGDLLTMFFADEIFDPANPDTFPEDV